MTTETEPTTDENYPMYCSECDDMVPENFDHAEDSWKCLECGTSPLYEDKEEYIEVIHGVARWQKKHGYGPWYQSEEA